MLVPDLKEILGKLGSSRSGRKDELKARVLALLNAGDPVLASRVAATVNDFFRRKTYGAMPTAGAFNDPYYNKPTAKPMTTPPGQQHSGLNALVRSDDKTADSSPLLRSRLSGWQQGVPGS